MTNFAVVKLKTYTVTEVDDYQARSMRERKIPIFPSRRQAWAVARRLTRKLEPGG